MRVAEAGIAELRKHVDTLLVIPNQNLFRIATDRTTFAEAFVLADQVLYSGIACIVDLIVKEGLINLDLADVKTVLGGMGTAMMGTGEASGEQRAIVASEEAIVNPLLDDISLKGAKSLLLSITGGRDLTLWEVDEAANRVRQEVDPDANIIVGATFDEALGDKVRVSIVASGMGRSHVHPPNARQMTAPGRRAPYRRRPPRLPHDLSPAAQRGHRRRQRPAAPDATSGSASSRRRLPRARQTSTSPRGRHNSPRSATRHAKRIGARSTEEQPFEAAPEGGRAQPSRIFLRMPSVSIGPRPATPPSMARRRSLRSCIKGNPNRRRPRRACCVGCTGVGPGKRDKNATLSCRSIPAVEAAPPPMKNKLICRCFLDAASVRCHSKPAYGCGGAVTQ